MVIKRHAMNILCFMTGFLPTEEQLESWPLRIQWISSYYRMSRDAVTINTHFSGQPVSELQQETAMDHLPPARPTAVCAAFHLILWKHSWNWGCCCAAQPGAPLWEARDYRGGSSCPHTLLTHTEQPPYPWFLAFLPFMPSTSSHLGRNASR